MSKLTLVGKVTDSLGHATHRSYGWEGNAAVEHRTYEALASTEYRTHQPAPIPVRRSHGASRDIGRCCHLERAPDDSITAVAQVDGVDDLLSLRHGPVYWSPGLLYRAVDGRDIQIVELVVTTDPATYGLAPLELIPGDTHQAADWVRCRHRPQLAALLDRAETADRRRPLGAPISIHDRVALQVEQLPNGAWIDGRGRPVAVSEGRGRQRPLAPSSNSVRFRWIDGRRVEIEHTAPYYGSVIAVR